MIRLLLSGCFAFAALASLPVLGEEPVSPDSVVDEYDAVLDLIFCAPRRPLLIRFHLYVNGKGFRSLRRAWADSLFDSLDADKSGLLEGAEVEKLPSRDMLRSGLASDANSLIPADSAPADGKVSREECRRYLIAISGTPFSIEQDANAGNGQFVNINGQNAQVNLFPKLDQNQDAKLSIEEIESAAERLRRYDRNEDDILEAVELQQSLPDEQVFARQQLAGVLGLLAVVDASEGGSGIARRLIEGYDKASRDPVAKIFRKDEQLSQRELGIDQADFARADRNGDGKLDRSEIARLSEAMTPTVELEIHAPADAGTQPIKVLRRSDPEFASLLNVEEIGSGPCRLTLSDTSFDLRSALAPADSAKEMRQNILRQFKTFDGDNNDYVDTAEAQRFGHDSAFFTQADADHDGKVFEPEYVAQVDRELALSTSSMTMSISSDGQSLFRLFDANSDNRLSLRELRDVAAQFSKWDANGDQVVSLSELAIQLNATLTAGNPQVRGLPLFARRTAVARTQQAPRAKTGWFEKLDRNGDGDLSRNEFPGTRVLFEKLDTNRDGLISSPEAEQAVRELSGNP